MRIKWVDYGKGLAILLVLVGHVILGLVRSGNYPEDNEAMRTFLELIYAFHMPVFFALSGYFFKPLDNLKSWLMMVGNKFLALGIPYVLFSIVMVFLQYLGGSAVRDASGLSELLVIYRTPIGYLWFLYTLFFIFFFVGLLSIKIKNVKTLFLILLAGYFIGSIVDFKIFFLQRFLVWAPIFYAGFVVKNINKKIESKWLFFIASILYVTHVPIFRLLNPSADYASQSNPQVWGLFSFIGIYIGFVMFYKIKDTNPISKVLDYLGQNSMIIYLVHAPVASIVRIALYKVGLYNLSVNILLGIILTFAISLASVEVAKRIRLFEFTFYPLRYIKFREKSV